MSLYFERPVGAAADARELEYVAALHQTQDDDDDGWMDGSIEATDVKNYLLSRYGVQVTKQEVLDLIFEDLGGGDDADECIDLTEVVAILLIPYLAKISLTGGNEEEEENRKSRLQSQFEIDAHRKSMSLKNLRLDDKKIISSVLKMILADATGSSDLTQPLTKDLLRQIFRFYGESGLVKDDTLIDEMIETAAGGEENPVLSVEAFLRALTHDTKLYDVTNESKFQTHYEDVFGLVSQEDENRQHDVSQDNAEAGVYDLSKDGGRPVKRIFTFPQIDFLADTFRSKAQYVFAWLGVLQFYIFYVAMNGSSLDFTVCYEEYSESFGCQIAQSIVMWLIVMLQMVILIGPGVMLLNLGNNVYTHSALEILAGITGTVVIVFLPMVIKFQSAFISTHNPDEEYPAIFDTIRYTLSSFIGIVLILLQVSNIVRFCVPDSRLTKSKVLTSLLRGSSVRAEFGLKQATIFKVNQMVNNAFELHEIGQSKDKSKKNVENDHEEGGDATATNGIGLLNFTKVTEKRETCGGFLWAWKACLSDHLVEQEGIWLSTKLLAGNVASVVITLAIALFAFILMQVIADATLQQVDDDIAGDNNIADHNTECYFSFDPDSCYYPEVNGTATGLALCPDVFVGELECEKTFVNATGPIYEGACDLFTEGVKQLPPPASYVYDECPSLYIPWPDVVYASAEGSDDVNYCLASMSACSGPQISEFGLSFDVCTLGSGIMNPAPYQFVGNNCANYTALESTFEGKAKVNESVRDAIEPYLPRKWQINLSLYSGMFFVFLVGFSNAAATIPSIIITTLKYRSGALPSLRDPYFKKYRKGLLNTTFLLGGTMWGTIFSLVVTFVIIFVVTFLFAYQVTRPYILSFSSLLIGILVTLTLKVIASQILNKIGFVGFYRKRPLNANISNLFFECWHLALTLSYIFLRVVKLFVVVTIYIGRFDTPILAQGVDEFGAIRLDAFPFIFRQNLLAIDAHRHPYLERLGLLYLMKLKHGENFAKKSGSIWRLLFVFALFPWLRQYRVINDAEMIDTDGLETGGLSKSFANKIALLNQKVRRLTEVNKNLKRD